MVVSHDEVKVALERIIEGQVTLEWVEGEETYDRLTIETKRGTVILRSQDFEGYRSWFSLESE